MGKYFGKENSCNIALFEKFVCKITIKRKNRGIYRYFAALKATGKISKVKK